MLPRLQLFFQLHSLILVTDAALIMSAVLPDLFLYLSKSELHLAFLDVGNGKIPCSILLCSFRLLVEMLLESSVNPLALGSNFLASVAIPDTTAVTDLREVVLA